VGAQNAMQDKHKSSGDYKLDKNDIPIHPWRIGLCSSQQILQCAFVFALYISDEMIFFVASGAYFIFPSGIPLMKSQNW
jgi:hypothetical protein